MVLVEMCLSYHELHSNFGCEKLRQKVHSCELSKTFSNHEEQFFLSILHTDIGFLVGSIAPDYKHLFPSMLKSWPCSKSLVTIVLPSKAWKTGGVLGGSRFPLLLCQNSFGLHTVQNWIRNHPNPSPPCGTSFGGSLGGSACNGVHIGLMGLILLSICFLKHEKLP